MPGSSAAALQLWLQPRITAAQWAWLTGRLEKHQSSAGERDLHITLGFIPRKLGKQDLGLSAIELAQAELLRSGWQPINWSIDTAARVAVLCCYAEYHPQHFEQVLLDLFRTADVAESIAFYSGVALFPQSNALDKQIADGLRSNMRSVFESIAHHNPYPADNFDENRWNHMVLKALFVESELAPIFGLRQRANAELALILCDYAHERWAAGRDVSPELWRCVGPYAKGTMLSDLQRALNSNVKVQHRAAALALSDCGDPHAAQLLAAHTSTVALIQSGQLTWEQLEGPGTVAAC